MPPRKFVNKIKDYNLPYHIVEDPSVPHNLLCDQTVFNQLKRKSNIHANLDSSMVMVGLTEASPDLQLTDRSNISKRSTTTRGGKLERQNTFEVRQPTRDYFGAATSISSLVTTKIKCKSMERVGLNDLAYFYRYKQTLKTAKRTCDLNMIHLLEVLRTTFSGHKKETLHQISSEVSQSIVQFISSSVTELRFGRCKALLQKFEEAETRVSDLLNIPSTNKLSQPTSPLTVNQGSKLTPRSHEKLTPPSIKPLADDKSDVSADRSIENKQNLKVPNLSLKNYFPVLCNPSPQSISSKHGPKLSIDSKNVKIDFEEMIGQRELLSILGRVKYCVWSVGHLIQYDRISNSNVEKLIKYTSQKRSRNVTGKRDSFHTPVTTPGGRRDSNHTNNGNRSHGLPSLELDNEPIELPKVEDFSDMKNIKNYMFNYSNLLDDLDEEKVSKRLDNLSKYSVWKMKKWVTNYQREKIEQKHQDYKVVCKICALELKIDIAKEHLDLCKNRAELNQETKNLDKKFAEFIMEAFIKSKNINTKLIIDGNNYSKLKNKYLKFDGGSGTLSAKRLFTHKLKTDNISSPANTDSPHTRSPDKDGLGSPAKKKVLMRGKTMKIQSSFLAELQQGEQANTPEKKQPKHIGIVRMNTINPGTEPSTAAELKPKANVLNTSLLLKSYHNYADSPMRKLGEASQPKPVLDPRSSVKTSDSSKSRRNNLQLHFYSDVNRSDAESDHSVDSRHSKESYASAPAGQFLEIQNLAEYSNMQLSDLSSTERSASSSTTQSPAITAGKNFTSPIGKSAFFKKKDGKILNLEETMRKVDTQEDEREEETQQDQEREECKDQEQESQHIPEQSSRFIEETESSILIPRMSSEDQYTPNNDQKPQTIDKNSINQIAKQMAKLKIEIDRKKVIIAFYEFIMAKAKQVTNQELESEMIEIVRDDTEIEIKNFNSRIDDEEADSFAKKFLTTLNKRLVASTNLFEVTQRLDALQGKSDDQASVNRKCLDRKTSMLFISNRYGSPKGNNPVDSFGVSLSGSRILSRTPPSANTPRHRRNYSNRTNDGRYSNPNKERPKVYEPKDNDKEFSINNQAETFDQGENITHKESDKTDFTDQTNDIASHRKPNDEHETGKLAVEDLSSSDSDDSCDHESEDKNTQSFRDDRSDNQKEEEEAFKKRQERYPTLNPEESFRTDTGKAVFEAMYTQEKSTSAGDSQVRIQLSQELEMKTPDFMKSFAETVHIDPFDPIAKNSPQTPSFENKIFQTSPSKFNFGHVSNAKSLADMKKEMFKRSATNDFEKLVKNILNTDSSPKKVQPGGGHHKTQIINPRPFMEDDLVSPQKPANFFKDEQPPEEHSEMVSTNFDRKARSQRNSITEAPSSSIKLIVRGFDKNGRTIVDSSPKLPPDTTAAHGSTPKTKRRLSASQMFEMFEDKETYNMNRLPSLNKIKPDVEGGEQDVDDIDDSPPHKSPDFTKRTGKFFAEDSINGSNEDLKDQVGSQWLIESPVIQKGYYSDSHVKNVKIKIQKKPQIGIHDFEQVKLISKGAFGKVVLVKRKATNDYYAMKLINLGEKTMKNSVKELENLRKEDKIFGLTQKQGVSQKDFIVRADFTFTHETYICFVMEYIIGGDFGDIMHNYGCLDQNVAKFYIAEIILALEYLHSLGIVHRDLKPDNILLDKKGHVKLTDFGLSDVGLSRRIKNGNLNSDANADSDVPSSPEKSHFRQTVRLIMNGKTLEKKHEVIYKDNYDKLTPESLTKDSREVSNPDLNSGSDKKKGSRRKHRLIGTPDYMPPEIIQGISLNNPTIDWWSLGVILFEFLCGVPPFNDESPKKIYQNILERRIPWDQVEIGYDEDCVTPEAQDLINQLLTLDHTKRIGSNGASEIKNHPFFAGISWDTLRTQRAPIIPEQKGAEDTENFVRLKDKITDKDKEVFISALMKQIEQNPNMVAAKQLLEAHPEIFDMFNYSALYSDNVKSVDEILKKMKKELDQFEECDDNIFDLPKWLLNNDKELNSKDSLDSNKDLQEKEK